MALYNPNNTPTENLELLARNPYPGRLLIMGYAGDVAVQAYAIGGRSEGSRNRVFELQDNIISTAVFNENLPQADPTLTIYDAMRRVDGVHIVSNGDQTNTIAQYIRSYSNFRAAMKARTYEPDAPNYTPRITGIIENDVAPWFDISVIRRGGGGQPIHSFYDGKQLDVKHDGVGFGVHTYSGEKDGILQPYDEPPAKLPVLDNAEDMAELLWDKLDKSTMVAVVAKAISATGEVDFHVINGHEQ